MDATLAHAGGLDELAIILFPIIVGLGVWLLTRQSKPKTDAERVAPRSRPPSKHGQWTNPAGPGE
ncbi:MAG: hypothetical protein ACRDZ3_22280 [Acidimicrobiia bacterium]